MSDVELTPVREAHRFDEAALITYLEQNVEGFAGPVTITQFEGGQSNPTFQLDTPNRQYVLRKQPPGKLLPSAHQVDREYRVMNAIKDSGVPVPKMYCACDDSSIIGTKFYLMERIDGRLFTTLTLPELSKSDRFEVYAELARGLAALHGVDHKAVGLEDFGRPGNYYERQIGRWSKQYLAAETEDSTAMKELMAWLPDNIPDDDSVGIVHGDYRLGNCLFHPTEPKLLAVLDWELCTIGHPLGDLGYLCQSYFMSTDEKTSLGAINLDEQGIPDFEKLVEIYCQAAGRDGIENVYFYVIFSCFRMASIVQGVYKRGLDGNASSQKALDFKGVADLIAQVALSLRGR